jgi:hypothetical protein
MNPVTPGNASSIRSYPAFEPDANHSLLVFIALSCLGHVILLAWAHPLLFISHATGPQLVQVLHVQLQNMATTQAHPKTKARHAARSIPPARKPTTTSPTRQATPSTTGTSDRTVPDKTAAKMVEEALKAAPQISRELETEHPGPGHALIFDPTLRARLEKARRDQARYDAVMQALAQHPEIEVMKKSEHYVEIRIHGLCWQIPVSSSYDPFDPRIAMQNTNCPQQKFELPGKHLQTSPP